MLKYTPDHVTYLLKGPSVTSHCQKNSIQICFQDNKALQGQSCIPAWPNSRAVHAPAILQSQSRPQVLSHLIAFLPTFLSLAMLFPQLFMPDSFLFYRCQLYCHHLREAFFLPTLCKVSYSPYSSPFYPLYYCIYFL